MTNLNMMLSLGGQERELKFAKMSFLKHLGRVSNGYNFIQTGIVFDPGKIYESVLYFVWAGLLGEEVDRIKYLPENADKEPDELHELALKVITKRKVSDSVDDLSFETMMDIQYHAWAAMSGKTIEEIKNPTAQVSNNGAVEKIL